jgi:hypothetical protein
VKQIVFGLSMVFFSIALSGQQPSAVKPQAAQVPAAAPAAPTLNEDDVTLLTTLNVLLQVANRDCQGLDSVKAYNTQRTAVLTRIEAKYPGYTLNANGAGLVAKAPAPAGK